MRRRISVLVAIGFALLLGLGVLTSLAMIAGQRATMSHAAASQAAALEVRASVRNLRADYLAGSDAVSRFLLEPDWSDVGGTLARADVAAAGHIAAAARATRRPELKAVLSALRRHDRRATDPLERRLVALAPVDATAARAVYLREYLPARARNLALVEQALALAVDEVAGEVLHTQEQAKQSIALAALALVLFVLVGTTAGYRLSTVVRDVVRDFEDTAAQVREQRDHLHAVMTAIRDALLVIDAHGRMVMVNDAACALLGYGRAELTAARVDHRLGAGVEEAVSSLAGSDASNHPIPFTARDGVRIPMSVSAAPLRAPDGDVVGAVWVARDMRDHLRMLAEIEAARDAALEGSRTKSEFLANMSHEIRTPMHVIIGYTDMALGVDDCSDEQRFYLDGIRRSSLALLEIINDILDLSKVEAGKLALEDVVFGLRETVHEIGATLGLQAREKGLRLEVAVDERTPEACRGDPTRLRQVIVNLLGNAIKFTDAGDVSLRVGVEPVGGGDMVLHGTVSDTGIGIPADKLELVFGAFTQADGSMTRRYGGTGLGLTIAARLVAMMGGRIRAESELGRGSRFHFTVRLRRADTSAADVASDRPALAATPRV